MDVRATPGLSSKEKLRNMEEELKKWREEKKRQSLVVTKENQALNVAKTPSVRKSTAVFTPSVAKAVPQTTQIDHKFKRRSEVPVAPMTPSVRSDNTSVLSDASMNLLKRKLEMSFDEADDKSEKNKLLQAVQQQQANDQATIERRLLLEKWRKEKEEQKQKEREKKRQSTQPRYNQPAGVVSPFHKKCKHAGPCDHNEQVEFKTPAKPVVKKPAKPVGHQSQDSMQGAFKFVPATAAMFSNPYKMFDPLSDPRRLTLGGVTARQLLSELTPKSNTAAFKQLTEAVANNSFFQRTVRKVAKEIIRHHAAQKCMHIMKGSDYEKVMAAFDAMQFEASWPVVRKCAFYWLFRAKVEERHGDYKRAISTFEAATRNQATPIEMIHNGLQQFMATLRRLAGQNKAAATEKKQEIKVEQKPVEIKIEPIREPVIEAHHPVEPIAESEVEQVTDAVADLAIEETHEDDFEPITDFDETVEATHHEEAPLEPIEEEEETTYYIPQGGLVVTPAKTPRSKLAGFKKVQRMSMTPLGKPGRILVENAEPSVVQPRSLNFDRDSFDSLTSATDNQPAYYGEDDVPMSDDVEEHYEQSEAAVEPPAPVEEEEIATNEKVTLVFDKVDANVQDDTYYVLEKHKLNKKEKEEFGTEVALTPARRSVRLVPHARKQDEDVAKMLEEVQYSYTPNKALKTFEQPKKGKKKILSSAEELMRTLQENKKQDERKKREKKAALAEPITEEEEVEEAKRLSLLPGEILNAPEPIYMSYKKVHPSLYKQFQKVPSERGFGLYSEVVPVRDKAAHVEMPTPVRRSHRLHKK